MRPVTKNILSLSIGDLVSLVLGFVAKAFLVRALGSSGFGRISFAFAIFSYSFIVINLGLVTIGAREVAKDRNQTPRLVSNMFGLRLFLALTVFCIVILLTFLVDKFQSIRPILIMYHLALFPYALYLDWFFQGTESMEAIGYSRIVNSAIYLILVLAFVRSIHNVVLIPIFYSTGVAVAAVLLLSVYLIGFGRFSISLRLRVWHDLIKVALPVGIGTISAEITRNFPIIIIGFLRNEILVGYYSVAHTLVYLALIVDRVFFIILLPAAVRFYKEGTEQLRVTLERSTRLIAVIIIPTALGCAILAPNIVSLVFGPDYGASVLVFRILIWYFVLTVFNTVYCCSLIATNQEKKYAFNIFIGTIIHLIANYIMTLLWGITGTALSVILSETAVLLLMYWRFKPTIDIKFWAYVVKPVIGSLVMAISLLCVMRLNVLFAIVVSILAYLISLHFLKGATRDDLVFLGKVLSLDVNSCKKS